MMPDKRERLVRARDFAGETRRRFAKTLRESAWFRPGLKLGVAVSGGADSVALLKLLAELRAELGLVLSAVHFNHQLRGKASNADEKFVAALAEKLGLSQHLGHGDVARHAAKEKSNLEDAARRARYSFFARLIEQGVVDRVATAHTMDDQAETVLAHALRGTGIAGLAGIHPIAGGVVRPVLSFRRDELRKYLRSINQVWREDATNQDTNRTRARIRKKLLPLLTREFNPSVIEHLASLAERAREQAALGESLTARVIGQVESSEGKQVRISLTEFLQPLGLEGSDACAALRGKLAQEIIARCRIRRGQISAVHLAAIEALARGREPGKRLQLPGGVDVLCERDALVFRPRGRSN